MHRDTVIGFFSDTHTGSPLGLIRPKQWQLQNGNYSPNKIQKDIWGQYKKAGNEIAKLRRDKNFIAMFVGDAKEGRDHHHNQQFITPYDHEEEKIATDALDYGLRYMDYKDGDKFYMVAGTKSHVGEGEERIAEKLEPIPFFVGRDNDGEENVIRYCWPSVELKINGIYGLVAHQGVGPGNGANEGNPLYNNLRSIYYSFLARRKPIPRFIVYGHRHVKQHVQYRNGNDVIDGFLLSSYQAKTDYVNAFDPFSASSIGSLSLSISKNGELSYQWHTMTISE